MMMERTMRDAPQSTLTLALQADAVLVTIAGLALAVGATPVGDLLDLDPSLLRTVGVALLPWAAWVGWVSAHQRATLIRSVIVGNALWVLASLLALVAQAIEPNGFGIAFVLLQAALVASIAAWQAIAQRSAPIV